MRPTRGLARCGGPLPGAELTVVLESTGWALLRRAADPPVIELPKMVFNGCRFSAHTDDASWLFKISRLKPKRADPCDPCTLSSYFTNTGISQMQLNWTNRLRHFSKLISFCKFLRDFVKSLTQILEIDEEKAFHIFILWTFYIALFAKLSHVSYCLVFVSFGFYLPVWPNTLLSQLCLTASLYHCMYICSTLLQVAKQAKPLGAGTGWSSVTRPASAAQQMAGNWWRREQK